MDDDGIFLTRPKGAETEDRLGNPGLAEFNAFLRDGDTEPVDPFSLKTASAVDGTVAVCVGLYDRHVSQALANETACFMEIMSQSIEIDLCDCRTMLHE